MPAENDKTSYVVGVDFGGTKILAGVFDEKFNCIGRARVSTKADRGVDEVIGRIARSVREAVDEIDLDLKQIKAIGIGAPGAVDSESGKVIFAPNLGWDDVPLKKELEKQIDAPVFLENDCNVCTLGIYEVELKAKPRDVVGIFLGTGIGGGLIVEGQLYSGFNRTAGEIGHMVIQVGGPKCGCGNKGCFEALASRTANVVLEPRPIVWRENLGLRGLTALPVTFEMAEPAMLSLNPIQSAEAVCPYHG